MPTNLRQAPLPGGATLELVEGDITQESVDAIVNAANARLLHGGGVAAAIARKGGKSIQQESRKWVRANGPVSHAKPAYTQAGNLPCKYVIHAVGPVWGSGDDDRKLAQAVQGALECAEQLELRSIAFPAISTGIFGFPKKRAAKIMLKTCMAFFEQKLEGHLKIVRFTLYDHSTTSAFTTVWDTLFPAS